MKMISEITILYLTSHSCQKVTERIIKSHKLIADYIYLSTTSSILSSLPISNIHSIETTLLSVHDHIISSTWEVRYRTIITEIIFIYIGNICWGEDVQNSFWFDQDIAAFDTVDSWTSFILVWHFFYCSLFVDQILFTKPFFLCQYWQL